MKATYIALALCACLAAAAGCSRDRDEAGFDGIFGKLQRARGYAEAKRYYTGGTIDALDGAVRGGVIAEADRLSVLPLFNDRTEWEELSKNVEGSKGIIRIRYTAHPVENMIGFEMVFRVVKEGGSWKLDLADEIRDAVERRRKGSASDYIRRIMRGY